MSEKPQKKIQRLHSNWDALPAIARRMLSIPGIQKFETDEKGKVVNINGTAIASKEEMEAYLKKLKKEHANEK